MKKVLYPQSMSGLCIMSVHRSFCRFCHALHCLMTYSRKVNILDLDSSEV